MNKIKNEEDSHMGAFNQLLTTNGRETVSNKLGILGSIFNMFNLGDQLEHRSALRYDQKILNAFSRIWSYMDKTDNGYIAKAEYINLLTRFSKVLAPHLSESEAKKQLSRTGLKILMEVIT